ncbi:MAG TPA: hypothetical protein VEQ85_10455 [Lacipirellulaceae bacterium]|nr:hypothetical protein [Lacipirellulaceae bacterium]
MVTRQRKLVAAGAVLGIGLALALLFRRPAEDAAPVVPAAVALPVAAAPVGFAPPAAAWALDGQRSPQPPVPASTASLTLGSGQSSAGLPDASAAAPPAFAAEPQAPLPLSPNPAPLAADGPAALGGGIGGADAESPAPGGQPAYRAYVIHEGDSLESLAERYLGDGARALELFDLNRDVLENPHLLPRGAELRIPRGDDAGD